MLSTLLISLPTLHRLMANISTSGVLLLVLSICVSAQTLSCNYQQQKGIAKEALRISSSTAESSIDCVISSCGCEASCAASFNPGTKQCWKAFKAFFDQNLFVFVTDSDSWVTYFIPGPNYIPPGLWRFDDVNKGRNLGKKGAQLDMSVEGLVWNKVGPRGAASSRKYPSYVGPGIPTIQIKHNESHALTFTGPYTITVWVKTENIEETMLILEGYPRNALEFWMEPSKERDQLSLNPGYPNHMYTTSRNSTGRDEWRHMAFVFRKIGDVSFYLNGDIWSHTIKTVSTTILQPDKFCLWKHCEYSKKLSGSLASLIFFDKALSQAEVKFAMNICP